MGLLRDPRRVLKGSAACKSGGVSRRWDADKEAAAAAEREKAFQEAKRAEAAAHGSEGHMAKEGEMCMFPEEARSDPRYRRGDDKCSICGGGLPVLHYYEDVAERRRAKKERGMDGVVGWVTAQKGNTWQGVGLHTACGMGTCEQNTDQFEVPHHETDPHMMYEKGVALELAAGRKGRARPDRQADMRKAAGWYRAAAFQGNSKGMYKLGICHLHGRGAPLEPEQAVVFLERCALVEPEGAFELAKCYEKGIGLKSDQVKAQSWYRHAADIGHQGAALVLMSTSDKSDSTKAKAQLELYHNRARAGDIEARYQVAVHLMEGRACARDEKAACAMYHEVAMQGHAASMCAYALCCLHGRGTSPSMDQAITWLHVSARNGHGVAQSELASMYEDGIGVEKDAAQAERLKEHAAKWEEGEVANYSLSLAKPMGGFLSIHGRDLIPYFEHCLQELGRLMQRLAVLALSRHMLCAIMVRRRRKPTDSRPLLIPQQDWRAPRERTAAAEKGAEQLMEPLCLLLGVEIHLMTLSEAVLLEDDVHTMLQIVSERTEKVRGKGAVGKVMRAAWNLVDEIHAERKGLGAREDFATLVQKHTKESMFHIRWERDEVQDYHHVLDVGDTADFVVRFDREKQAMYAAFIYKSWMRDIQRPGSLLVLPREADDSAEYYDMVKTHSHLKEELETVSLCIVSKYTKEQDRKKLLEGQEKMKKEEKELSSALDMLQKKVNQQGKPWWDELWSKNMEDPIHDKKEVFESSKIRDAGFKMVTGRVTELHEGDADAQFDLGYRYMVGKGVERDGRKGVYWLKKASSQGQKYAQCAMGVCYYLGESMPRQDRIKAKLLLEAAAQQGVPLAHTYLADLYRQGHIRGENVTAGPDVREMLDSLRAGLTSSKAQALSHQKAAFRLGELHTHASLLPGPERRVELQGKRGALRGQDARAHGPDYKLSGMLEQPLLVRDDAKGVEYFQAARQHAATAPPYPPAVSSLGEMCEMGAAAGGHDKAFQLYAQAAETVAKGPVARAQDARAKSNLRFLPAHMGDMSHGAGGRWEGQGWDEQTKSVADRLEELIGSSVKF